MKRLVLYLFLLVNSLTVAFGQDVIVKAKFDSTRIYLGDQINFTVSVDKPSGIRLGLPFLKDTLCKNIEIISGPVIDSMPDNNGRIKIISKYLITSFDSGYYQVKPVFAELKEKEGIKRFYSDYSQLEVMRVKIAPADTTAKIYDIIQPYRAPLTFGEIMPWMLLLLVIGAIAWLTIRYIKSHRKTEKGSEPLINPDPAHIIAFRELESLKSKELWQKGEIKKYYTELTEILRQYLENRYNVYSMEMTTMETLETLLKTGFKKDDLYNTIKSVLTGADLVKFAKYIPQPEEHESHFNKAWSFVDNTKMIEIKTEISDSVVEDKEGIA